MIKPGTVKTWIRLEKKMIEARNEFKKYNDRIRALPAGYYSLPGCPSFEVIEQEYSVPDTQEMLRLEPDLRDVVKTVKRKRVKK